MDAGGNDVSFTSKENLDFLQPRLRLRLDQVTGVQGEGNNKSEIQIFPNPSSNGIFYLSQKTKFQITNSLGNHVLSASGDEIDLSNQADGVYFLRVENTVVKIFK